MPHPRLVSVLLRALFRPHADERLVRLGSRECGWVVPQRLVRKGAVCYCVGAGEDVSFDLELARRGCSVWIIDPTPRAADHVERAIAGTAVRFLPVGIWSSNARMRFYAPRDPRHVSHSIVNLQQTETFFEAECRTLGTVMRELDHEKLDIVKLDIEGAEHAVLADILAQQLPVECICVEYDQPSPISGAIETSRGLLAAGYRFASLDGLNCTFVRPP